VIRRQGCCLLKVLGGKPIVMCTYRISRRCGNPVPCYSAIAVPQRNAGMLLPRNQAVTETQQLIPKLNCGRFTGFNSWEASYIFEDVQNLLWQFVDISSVDGRKRS
jgi:hypothetical protein